MKRILLYHVYPVNNWREITQELFVRTPFDHIVVHVSLPVDDSVSRTDVISFFTPYSVSSILFSLNSGTGEVDALRAFTTHTDLRDFDILTYLHSKGVTKTDNPHVRAWTSMMRYFVIDRMDLCERAFRRGFVTYGINKSPVTRVAAGFRGSRFFYEGNFVSLNLRRVNLREAVERLLENDYYGVEGFWGKLCSFRLGYSPFDSGVNHYTSSVSPKIYRSATGRCRYRFIRSFYKVRAYFKKQTNHASHPE